VKISLKFVWYFWRSDLDRHVWYLHLYFMLTGEPG